MQSSQYKKSSDENTDRENELLFFEVNSEVFACGLVEISEVIEPVALKKVPKTDAFYEGVFDLRGQIVGALDLRTLFATGPVEKSNAFIICDLNEKKVALIIDRCRSVQRVKDSQMQELARIQSQFPEEVVKGYCNVNDEIVAVLDINKVILGRHSVENGSGKSDQAAGEPA